MKLLILMLTSLTNFYTLTQYGDPLEFKSLSFHEPFGKYYINFTFNSAVVNEYRYQYLYDSYNNTVGRQITYQRSNYYLLKPDVLLGYNLRKIKTFLFFRGITDLNYIYERIQYNTNYQVEDTVREEREGDIFEGGLAVSLAFSSFRVVTGLGLLNKNLPSLAQRTVRALAGVGYLTNSFGISIQASTKAKFPEENFYSLPNQATLSGYYNPAIKSGAKIDFDLLYKRFSKIDTALKDYWIGSVGISHSFRDMTLLRVGGLLEKSFTNDTYIPGIDITLGYKMRPFYFSLDLCKKFISYSQSGELIEENPFKIRFNIKVVD